MTRLRVLLARVKAMLSGARDLQLAEELLSHVELLVAEHERRGLSPTDARAAALRDFGGVRQLKEIYREQQRLPWFDELGRDVRHALRTLAKNPGFTSAAMLTLSLGIGANAAMFSVINAVLLRPLPYTNSERIVRLVENVPAEESPTHRPQRRTAMDTYEFGEWRKQTRTLSYMAAYSSTPMTFTSSAGAVRLTAASVSPSLFPLLGVGPLLGRVFEPSEEEPDSGGSVILSYGAWQRYFASRPDILGQPMTLDGRPFAIVGVMRAEFQFPDSQTQLWTPYALREAADGRTTRASVLARVGDGVPLETAAAEANTIVERLRGRRHAAAGPARMEVISLKDELIAPVRPALRVLFGAVGFVLLIACANVANLLLARGAARKGEIAIRAVLGASRGRLVQQLLTESMALALLGGVGGTALALYGIRVLQALGSTLQRLDLGPASLTTIPRLSEVSLDGTALGFTLAIAIVTGVLFGIVPALRLSRNDHGRALAEARNRVHAKSALVAVQIALATVLLVSAGLLIRSFLSLTTVPLGYDPSDVLTFQLVLPADRYSHAQARTFAEDLTQRFQAQPGVESAAYMQTLPMVAFKRIVPPLRTTSALPQQMPRLEDALNLRLVSHNYFRVMGVRIVEGRGLLETDAAGQPPVILVNRVLARAQFGRESPIGKRVYVVGPVSWEIVGIVEDVRQFGLDQDPEPQVFADFRQWPNLDALDTPRYFALRTAVPLAAIASGVRQTVQQVDPTATIDGVATMEQLVSNSVVRPRLYTVLLGIFGTVAGALAVIGVFGVCAYSVAQRTREIGIRMALGADSRHVLRSILRQSLAVAAFGILAGLAVASALTGYLETMLFGLTPLDPITFVGVGAAFALTAALASYLPARRATKVDPLIALRYE